MAKQKRAGRNHRDTRGCTREERQLAAIHNNVIAISEGPQNKKWTKHDIKNIQPITPALQDFFQAYYQGDHVVAFGVAGTGKTFTAMYLALSDIIDPDRPQRKLIIVRSIVPSRDIGFLPGTEEEKNAVYEEPYRSICAELFKRSTTYANMKEAGILEFKNTSFVRGTTWDDAVILLDEVQNMTFEEIDSVLTRVGTNSRVIICGDHRHQCDLKKEKTGVRELIEIATRMKDFSVIDSFTADDIIRSNFVKSWIIARDDL